MPMSLASARRAAICMFFLAALPFAAQAGEQPFLRGYAQALLDNDFPDLNLTVEQADTDDSVTLGAPQCLSSTQRDQVQSRLLKNPRVHAVHWNLPCNGASSATPAPGSQPPPAQASATQTLPNHKIFQQLLADPRALRFSGYYQYHKNNGKEFSAGAASFGEDFGIVRSHFHGHSYQVGIEAGVFALFNLDTKSHDLVNADYMVGIPVTYRTGDFSYRARLYHISSHLGDEFLLNNPQVKRINLSYEVVDFLTSWSRWGYACTEVAAPSSRATRT